MAPPQTKITVPDHPIDNAPEFEQIDKEAKQSIGYINFTAFVWVKERNALRRIYTSHPVEYPVGGEKSFDPSSPWLQTVVHKQQPHLSSNQEEMKEAYVDTSKLIEMGIHQVWCFPVVINGETIGALNFSGKEGGYTQETIKVCQKMCEGDAKKAYEAYFKREGKPQ